MQGKRLIWVDDVKVIACILVVLGYFFQSMTKSNILPANNLYEWFNQTIYYFHVPLFLICSGYLYQKFAKIDNVKSWRDNIMKKAIALGVPYFTFSFLTWLLKTIFSSQTNDNIGGLFETLFVSPASPYWYLYVLFFIFLITPTFKSRKMAIIGLGVALAGKIIILGGIGNNIYVASKVLSNEIWFVGGMCLTIVKWKPCRVLMSSLFGMGYIALSVVIYQKGIINGLVSFLMGTLACIVIVMLVARIDEIKAQSKMFQVLSAYTMPIFVMHTLFAAPFRAILLKIGIYSAVIHVIGGLMISIGGPIIASELMRKTKVFEFFLYPGKFIKIG